jgi:replicative DNA helicase
VRPDDVSSPDVRQAWALVEERVRTRRGLDGVAATRGLSPSQARLLAEALASPELGTLRERLEQLREASVRRRTLETLRVAARAIQSGQPLSEVQGVLESVPALLSGVRGRVRETTGDTLRIVEAAEAAWTTGRPLSLRTGWPDLDSRWRLLPQLHAIGAQPGVGKTAFVAGLVRQWTAARVKVGVLAYEDDGLDLQRRLLACDAGLSLAHLWGDEVPPVEKLDEVGRAVAQRQALEEYLLVDDAEEAPTAADAVASVRQMAARGCRVVVLDNLTCLRWGADERHHEVEAALVALRRAALALRVPVLVVGHLRRSESTRDETTRVPRLSDFAQSAAWERTCRSVLGLWRDEDTSALRARVLKQTNGRWGDEFALRLAESAAVAVDAVHAPPSESAPSESPRRGYRPTLLDD